MQWMEASDHEQGALNMFATEGPSKPGVSIWQAMLCHIHTMNRPSGNIYASMDVSHVFQNCI